MTKLKNKLKALTREVKVTHFFVRKVGKRWVFGGLLLTSVIGAGVVLADTVGVNGFDGQPLLVYSNNSYGTVTLQGTFAGQPLNTTEDSGKLSVNGTLAFCIDPPVPLDSNAQALLNQGTATWANLGASGQHTINALSYLARVKNHADTDPNMMLAAQYDIWHLEGVNATNFIPSAGSGTYWATIQTDEALLNNQAQQMNALPSFDGQTITLYAGQTLNLKDTNGVLSNFSQLVTNSSHLSYSVSGNQLTLKPTATSTQGTGTLTFETPELPAQPLVYGTINPDGTAGQNLVIGSPTQNQTTLHVKVVLGGAFKVTKLDLEDNSKVIPGTQFQLIDSSGNVVTKDADGKVLPNGGVFTTGSDGSIIGTNILAGQYKLREIFVPTPYTLSNQKTTVTDGQLSTDLPITIVAGTTATNPTGVTFSDNHQKEDITLQKAGILSGTSLLSNQYSLAGDVIQIKDTTKGTVVGNLVTDSQGRASTKGNLAMENQLSVDDDYTYQEIASGNGLAIPASEAQPHDFKLTYSGNDTQLINPTPVSLAVTNQEITGNLHFTKQDFDTQSGKTQGAGTFQGTTNTLFYRADVLDASGAILHHAGDKVKWTDGFAHLPIALSNGTKADSTFVSFVLNSSNFADIDHLPIGLYYTLEQKADGSSGAPYGYTQDTTKHTFTVSKQDDSIAHAVQQENVIESDHIDVIELKFDKVLEDNGSLTGLNDATFTLSPADSQTKDVMTQYEQFTKTATSGSGLGADGFSIQGLTHLKFPIGNWFLDETGVPDGTQAIHRLKITTAPTAFKAGAPSSYTMTVTDTVTNQVLYSGTVQSSTLLDANNVLFKVNLGLLTDKPVPQPTILTKAHAKDGSQSLLVGETQAVAYDDVLLTQVMEGEQEVGQLHRLITDKTGKVLENKVVSTLHFTIDSATVKAQENLLQTKVDTTQDTNVSVGSQVTYVWTEDLFKAGEDVTTAKPITSHNDLGDKAETLTVKLPTLKTKAHLTNGSQVLSSKDLSKQTPMYDVVSLTNVARGEQEVAQLHRVIRDAKDKIVSQAVVATVPFTLDSAAVEQQKNEVQAKVDTSKDGGLPMGQQVSYVWTEDLFAQGANVKTSKPIARHTDLNDQAETIQIVQIPAPQPTPQPTPQPKITPTPSYPKTGLDAQNILGVIGAFAVGFGVTFLGLSLYKKKMKAKNEKED